MNVRGVLSALKNAPLHIEVFEFGARYLCLLDCEECFHICDKR